MRKQKKYIRYSLLALNVVLVIAIVTFVIKGKPASINQSSSAVSSAADAPTAPLDQLSSVDVAVNTARMISAPETLSIKSLADSASAELLVPPTDTVAITKPQTIATALKSRKDIQVYTTVAGDTISSVAAKFSVTSDSILWSNGLTGNTVDVGKALNIPPVTGIVYTVKSGDTADSLATKYKANKDQIIEDNDAEVGGLRVGEQILIRGGQQPVVAVYSSWATVNAYGSFSPTYGYNGYDWGYCTWYAANRVPVPSNWGNANTWDNLAPLSGWTVNNTPRVGAVAQSNSGYFGHVAVVEEVSADGSQVKYSDMNGLAGYARVGYSGWVSSSYFNNYIYR